MWLAICQFEIQYKLRRTETYVYFLFLLVVSVFAFDFIYHDKEMGELTSSSPQVIGTVMAISSGFFMLITSMVMGVSVLKDYEYKMESLLFVTPIQKLDYLVGRYLGSLLILLAVFSALPLGMMIGDCMPWREGSVVLGSYFLSYLHTYTVVMLPSLFFGGSIFFVTGMLSRKMIVVYTQGLIFFLVLLISLKIENPMLSGVLDPFGHLAIVEVVANFNMANASGQLLPLRGVLLYNRLFWCIIGMFFLLYGYYKFAFALPLGRPNSRPDIKPKRKVATKMASGFTDLPPVKHGLQTSLEQLRASSFFYFVTILRKPSFWAIIACGLVTILVNSVHLGETYGVSSFPETYLILDELKEMSILFLLLMLGVFTSEVIWRERNNNVDQIIDALPVSDLVVIGGKFLGLASTYLVLLGCLLLFGISLQLLNGFYDFRLSTYFIGLGELWLLLVLYSSVAFFFQVLSNSKFIGHVLFIVFFILTGLLALLGHNHGLYDFGGPGLSDYSALNGFGHSYFPLLSFKAYWLAFCIGLLAISAALYPRGKDVSFHRRIQGLSHRFTPGVKGVVGFAYLSMLMLGAFIYFNTNLLNQFQSTADQLQIRASYEKILKHFEYLPQPRISDVSLSLKLYPEERGYDLEGTYVLVNRDSVIMEEIHVQTFKETLDTSNHISFDRAAVLSKNYLEFGYQIFGLVEPLQPGDSLSMNFKQLVVTRGFSPNGGSSEVIYNGTFISNDRFPSLGYNGEIEIENAADREAYGLDSSVGKASRDHPFELFNSRSGDDGNAIQFDITISTSIDQIAVAPGTLNREWIEGDRRFFRYSTIAPMINFYAVTSARYELKKEKVKAFPSSPGFVDLAVYYHPSHTHNIDNMMDGLKASLTYCSEAFGPYPYSSLKIVEVPREVDRAQSFPTLIACSESMGFVLDVDSSADLNVPFFITAHEVAHQWWGMQLVAANVKGRYLLLESLAHYSAIMTYEKAYGSEEAQRLITFEEERYYAGRQEDLDPEVPLIDATDQEYLYYSKGAIVFYNLQALMGEDKLNDALHSFVHDWNATKRIHQQKRFATSLDLLPYIKRNAPEGIQSSISAMFSEIGPIDQPIRMR